MMRHNVLVKRSEGFISKTIFFLTLLTSIWFLYKESNLLIDAIYFIIVLVLFIKFLIIKLYQ